MGFDFSSFFISSCYFFSLIYLFGFFTFHLRIKLYLIILFLKVKFNIKYYKN